MIHVNSGDLPRQSALTRLSSSSRRADMTIFDPSHFDNSFVIPA